MVTAAEPKVIADDALIPEPAEGGGGAPCEAESPRLPRWDFHPMSCTRPEGHRGAHAAAYWNDDAGEDTLGPIWLDE